LNRTDIAIFGVSVTRLRYCITLEGPVINTWGHRMGFVPRKSDHAECRGVYIPNFEYGGKIKIMP